LARRQEDNGRVASSERFVFFQVNLVAIYIENMDGFL